MDVWPVIIMYYDLTFPLDKGTGIVDPELLVVSIAASLVMFLVALVPGCMVELYRVFRHRSIRLYATVYALWCGIFTLSNMFVFHPPSCEACFQELVALAFHYRLISITTALVWVFAFLLPVMEAIVNRAQRRVLLLQTALLLLAYPAAHRGVFWFYRMHQDVIDQIQAML